MRKIILFAAVLFTANCGVIYHSSTVSEGVSDTGSNVRVVPITPETVLAANRSEYTPKQLPEIYFASTRGRGSVRVQGVASDPIYPPEIKPTSLELRIPPAAPASPYRIGVQDTLTLATAGDASSVDQLSGLISAESRRQGYTVQDNGFVSIPDVGRVSVVGKTLEQAESEIFNAMVEAGLNPAFSLEISDFASQRATIGGAVGSPAVIPLTLTQLRLNEAINSAGGFALTELDYASIRIFRGGSLYQIPVVDFYSRSDLQRLPLMDGDSVFVDTDYEYEKAQRYFEQQIQLADLKRSDRSNALQELQDEIDLRRQDVEEQRDNFESRIGFDAVDRDYVYIVGEVSSQSRVALPFERKASLADALYDEGGGVPSRTGNLSQIYVLRGSSDPREFSGVTAWHLDASNAANIFLATQLELRPNDVVFVAEQPVTRWNRALTQIGPSLVNSTVAGAVN